MKKYIVCAISCTLLLAACDVVDGYQPSLANPPANQAQYERDLAACKKWAEPTPEESQRTTEVAATGLFGLIGQAMATQIPEGTRADNSWARADDCMRGKGYLLKN